MPGKFGRFNDTKEEQKGSHSFDYWAYGVVFTYLQSNIQRILAHTRMGRFRSAVILVYEHEAISGGAHYDILYPVPRTPYSMSMSILARLVVAY